jgi:hypothetical protein
LSNQNSSLNARVSTTKRIAVPPSDRLTEVQRIIVVPTNLADLFTASV